MCTWEYCHVKKMCTYISYIDLYILSNFWNWWVFWRNFYSRVQNEHLTEKKNQATNSGLILPNLNFHQMKHLFVLWFFVQILFPLCIASCNTRHRKATWPKAEKNVCTKLYYSCNRRWLSSLFMSSGIFVHGT